MARKSTLPTQLRTAMRLCLKDCPACGRNGLKPGMKALTDSVLIIRRWSLRTVSMECRRCGFRFSFRWESFRNALSKAGELDCANRRKEEQKKCLDFYAGLAGLIQELLDYRAEEGNGAGGPESPFKLAMSASPDPDVTE